jgi:hypothetical protein
LLYELKDELERTAVTDLAFARSSEAGQSAKLLLSRASANSFLERFADELNTVFTAGTGRSHTKQKALPEGDNKGSIAKVARRLEHQASVQEREIKRLKQEKVKSEASVIKDTPAAQGSSTKKTT